MHYCLNKKELLLLLNLKSSIIESIDKEEKHLQSIIIESEAWNLEVSCLTYFLSQIIEATKKNTTINPQYYIDFAYNLYEKMYFFIQEFDIDFINIMFTYTRDSSLELKDNLINIQNNLKDYKYGKIVRS